MSERLAEFGVCDDGHNRNARRCDGTSGCTDADAVAYAGFLTKFANALHAAGDLALQVRLVGRRVLEDVSTFYKCAVC